MFDARRNSGQDEINTDEGQEMASMWKRGTERRTDAAVADTRPLYQRRNTSEQRLSALLGRQGSPP